MPTPNSCCNPFQRKGHNNIYKNLQLVTAKWNNKFQNLVGLFVCNACKCLIYKSNDVVVFHKKEKPTNVELLVDEASSSDDDTSTDDVKQDPNYDCPEVENEIRLKKVDSVLTELKEPPIKVRKSNCSEVQQQELQKTMEKLKSSFNKDTSFVPQSTIASQKYIGDLKEAFLQQKTRADKLNFLSAIPSDWSMKKMRSLFNISRRLARRAKKLQQNITEH